MKSLIVERIIIWFKKSLKKLIQTNATSHQIAMEFSAGAFIGVFPIFGFGWILAVGLSFLFKLNYTSTIIGSIGEISFMYLIGNLIISFIVSIFCYFIIKKMVTGYRIRKEIKIQEHIARRNGRSPIMWFILCALFPLLIIIVALLPAMVSKGYTKKCLSS